MYTWYESIFKDKATAEEWIPKINEFREKYFGERVYQTVSKLSVLNFDKLYEENRKNGAVLVPCGHDDETVAMGGSVNDIKRILFQTSNGNLNFIANCSCGHMGGNFNIGRICPKCNTVVRTPFADEISVKAWLEIPESLPPFLHPVVYRVLSKWMGSAKRTKNSSKSTILDAILNVEVDLPGELKQLGQGMRYFHDNFDDVIRFVANLKKGRQKENEKIFQFLDEWRDCIWTRHIPILNQSLHILTSSGSMVYNDDSSQYILKTCIELGDAVYQQRHQPTINNKIVEQHVFCTYKSWMEYTDSVIDVKIQGKTGFIRKLILGARLHCSARGVIVPIIGSAPGDEVELPWRMIVGLYRLEIINRLTIMNGLDANTACHYWHQAQVGIHPHAPDTPENQEVRKMIAAVKECLDALLAECPYKGFPIIMGRNPTLRHGAIQLFFCKHYKTDCTDDTIGMSPDSISAPNADFD